MIFLISIIIPILIVFFVFDKKSRSSILFLMIGIVTCFFCGELDGFLYEITDTDMQEFTINITPFVEEIAKAYPLLIFAFLFNPTKQKIEESAVIIGAGFAILENVFILSQNMSSVSIGLALIRGFGSGTMHAVSTLMIGYGISFIVVKRKLFVPGCIAMLSLAISYHSIYNEMVQSEYQILGFILPILTFIPLIITLKKPQISEFFDKLKKKRDTTDIPTAE